MMSLNGNYRGVRRVVALRSAGVLIGDSGVSLNRHEGAP